ncbi:hypothetical protein CMUS01_00765 [Colletotrichum musicola]|uniref:Uncharacterized protein n=1 Tax=Colletotrichum musicola TaxID=2175873 RepID=A0A8H6NYE5_9PEZI|nr:hypothetical protein CMUS01_00765 [Colletotrichum musicola]
MSKRVGRPGDGLASDRPGCGCEQRSERKKRARKAWHADGCSNASNKVDPAPSRQCNAAGHVRGICLPRRGVWRWRWVCWPVACRPSPSARFRNDTPPILLAGVAIITTAATIVWHRYHSISAGGGGDIGFPSLACQCGNATQKTAVH